MTIIGDSGHMPARPVPASMIMGEAWLFPGTGGESE